MAATQPRSQSPAPALPVLPEHVAAAARTLAPVVRETLLEPSPRLSAAVQQPVYLKREDLQVGRSYKVRGAFAFISALTPEQRAAGVACASAGNHAQGVAFACRRLRGAWGSNSSARAMQVCPCSVRSGKGVSGPNAAQATRCRHCVVKHSG